MVVDDADLPAKTPSPLALLQPFESAFQLRGNCTIETMAWWERDSSARTDVESEVTDGAGRAIREVFVNLHPLTAKCGVLVPQLAVFLSVPILTLRHAAGTSTTNAGVTCIVIGISRSSGFINIVVTVDVTLAVAGEAVAVDIVVVAVVTNTDIAVDINIIASSVTLLFISFGLNSSPSITYLNINWRLREIY